MYSKLILLLLLIILVVVLFYGLFFVITVNVVENEKPDLLDQTNFNFDTNNVNRLNIGNPDFAPYLDGSYKQVTNNYIPGMTHYSLGDEDTGPALHDVRVNIWRNKSDSKAFFVQCK